MPQDYADTYRPNMGFFLTRTSTLGWKKEGMSWKNRPDFFQHFDQSKIDSKCIDLLRALAEDGSTMAITTSLRLRFKLS
eukprot:g13171.t1